jgi:GNAT superfamily N-acetyltransferase
MEHLIQREAIHNLWTELTPLLERHRQELAPYPDWRLAPDHALYERIETAGNLRVYTVRTDQHTLVGYCILSLNRNPHYTDVRMAHQDVLFLIPECRRGGLGLALLRHIEAALRDEGVHCIAQRTKARQDLNLGPLFARLGYRETDHVWLKRLDVGSAIDPVRDHGVHQVRQDARDFYPHDALRVD